MNPLPEQRVLLQSVCLLFIVVLDCNSVIFHCQARKIDNILSLVRTSIALKCVLIRATVLRSESLESVIVVEVYEMNEAEPT